MNSFLRNIEVERDGGGILFWNEATGKHQHQAESRFPASVPLNDGDEEYVNKGSDKDEDVNKEESDEEGDDDEEEVIDINGVSIDEAGVNMTCKTDH